MNDMDIISELIEDILKEKSRFESEFNAKALNSYNLKTTYFSNIINDDQFRHKLIPTYLSQLEKFISCEKLLTNWSINYNVRFRVKSPETTQIKIKQYSNRELEKGGIPLKKSLNDFLGVRIVLPGIMSSEDEICSFLDFEKQLEKITKYYVRKDGNYCGIHCYFAKDNFTFPWELQIWDKENEEDNYKAHLIHEAQRKNESEGNLSDSFGSINKDI